MDIQKIFGDNVKRHRVSMGLRQRDLAKMAGLSSVFIYKVEAGIGNPSIKNAQNIAFALGVNVAALMSGPGEEVTDIDLEVAIGKLPDGAKRNIIDLARYIPNRKHVDVSPGTPESKHEFLTRNIQHDGKEPTEPVTKRR